MYLAYQAPEIINRENHGSSVDYYALGIILYELIKLVVINYSLT